MFPKIEHINDLLPHIKERGDNIRVKVDELTGKTVVCYMIQDGDLFTGPNAAFEKECRGITFHEDGSIAARCLHKFKNVGETEELMPQNLRWANVSRVMIKKDGSAVWPVFTVDQQFKFKTKKSFATKEAALADTLAAESLVKTIWIKMILANDMTPTFEVTSPKMPIVILYKQDELTLLHIRENVSGRYLTEQEIINLRPPFPIIENVMHKFVSPGVPANIVSWDKLKEYSETATGEEGVVIQFQDGDMVKLKTKWYSELHHFLVFLRERDVAESILNDTFDDLLGHFALAGKNQKSLRVIAEKLNFFLEQIKSSLDGLINEGHSKGCVTKKDWALTFKSHKYFSMLMKLVDQKDPNIREWYKKNQLSIDFSLAIISDS